MPQIPHLKNGIITASNGRLPRRLLLNGLQELPCGEDPLWSLTRRSHHWSFSYYCYCSDKCLKNPSWLLLKQTVTTRTHLRTRLHQSPELSDSLSGPTPPIAVNRLVIYLCYVKSKNSNSSVRQTSWGLLNWSCHWMIGLCLQSSILHLIHPFLSLTGASGELENYVLLWFLQVKKKRWSQFRPAQCNGYLESANHSHDSPIRPYLNPPWGWSFSSPNTISSSFYSFQAPSSYSKLLCDDQFLHLLILVFHFSEALISAHKFD